MTVLIGEKMRMATLKQLDNINKASIARGYNRNLDFKTYYITLQSKCFKTDPSLWHGMNTTIFLQPMAIHEYKSMQRCEPHIRAEIYDLSRNLAFIDIPLEMWLKLEEFDHTRAAA